MICSSWNSIFPYPTIVNTHTPYSMIWRLCELRSIFLSPTGVRKNTSNEQNVCSYYMLNHQIRCFHMTSRRPYWCPKTMERRPCWCPKPILWELSSFLMQTLSFVPINLYRCWPREWKHSIRGLLFDYKKNCYFAIGFYFFWKEY